MNGEQKFWISLWGLVVAVVVTLVIAEVISNLDYKKRISEAADPFAFACAYDSRANSRAECILYLTNCK